MSIKDIEHRFEEFSDAVNAHRTARSFRRRRYSCHRGWAVATRGALLRAVEKASTDASVLPKLDIGEARLTSQAFANASEINPAFRKPTIAEATTAGAGRMSFTTLLEKQYIVYPAG